ncbi:MULTISPECIES: 3-hydroxyacyl-CoA dehydrogenase NAD-binding domain-containing protein [Pseudonocardia]|uniref:L-carnitine dehydrogenase n=2 Tax=Pseudonocardia TaxID=1847 RepID=A0A1Y2N6U0_PSEAH|nr:MULTISPECIES: 3-hydroxyacyl-CoA dehydrogenase NAD-binding domain-containing protein [Pseudonocardia]OSY43173.1 L-carnitine dehydrogenase [Pseudonocardia autotrophica]TDN71661.1 carnitine 3-dehydrogenase [Pseudonocardia autotrophica]BBG02348.1 L-carnitine dehydrogenase [Pseudonocardia autotrophica]GEC23316.1 L-carnitine dehydrogenase [Pseudonocardia saturnea]
MSELPVPGSDPAGQPVSAIRTVACIGAGVIGGGWAAYFLARGLRVRAWDPAPDAGDRLRRTIDAAWPALTELGLADGADPAALELFPTAAEAVAGADFVQESAPEDLALKRALLAELAAAAGPGVVVASSTSGFPMSDMATEAADPGRLVVGHPFNPPYLIPLVEVVGGTATQAWATTRAAEFYRHIGKSVIEMDRELPGFIANRLQEAIWREALHMVAEGEATPEEIDRSITDGPGLRWPVHGPCLTFHLAGGEGGMAHMLDHFGPSLKAPWTRLDAPELTTALRDDMVAGAQVSAGGRPMAELVAERDRAVIAVRRAVEAARAAGGTGG